MGNNLTSHLPHHSPEDPIPVSVQPDKDTESPSSTLRRPFDWIPDETISRANMGNTLTSPLPYHSPDDPIPVSVQPDKDTEPPASTLRRPFDWIPDETISRIFAIGAEENSKMYWPTGPPDSTSMLSGTMISPFGQTASLVCKRWYILTRLRCNAHLWHVFARIDRRLEIDTITHLSIFKQVLIGSNGRDIYASICGSASGMGGPLNSGQLFRHITVIGLRILELYKSQLAELMVYLPDEFPINSVSGFASCPRLHSL